MIVVICLAVAVLLTLIIGNLLKIWMNDELYAKLTGELETDPPQTEEESNPNARRVNAYLFHLGDDIDLALGRTALSVPINTADGAMCYCSDLVEHYGLTTESEVTLDEALAEAYGMVPYISGVYYTNAFSSESADVRYAMALRDAAILREFLYAGGSEIVIRGIPLDVLTPAEVKEYVDVLRAATGDFYIGIALPWEMVREDRGWSVPAAFANVADFCVLDVTGVVLDENDSNEQGLSRSAEELLDACRYYTTQYKLRVLASDRQPGLITTMEVLQVTNFQITRGVEIEMPPVDEPVEE
jgi:hypothetical protein